MGPHVAPGDSGERIAEIGAGGGCDLLKTLDNVRMFRCDVPLLGGIVLEVVKREADLLEAVAVPAGDAANAG